MSEGTHPNVFPTLRYKDASAALEWLVRAFGFEEKAVYRGEDGAIQHAELRLGTGMIMFGQHRQGWIGSKPPDSFASPQSIYVVVDDPDAHHDRAVNAGAQVVRELADEDYGSRE